MSMYRGELCSDFDTNTRGLEPRHHYVLAKMWEKTPKQRWTTLVSQLRKT